MKGKTFFMVLGALALTFISGYMIGRSGFPSLEAPESIGTASGENGDREIKKDKIRPPVPERKTGTSPLPEKIKRGDRWLINLSNNPGKSFFPIITSDKDNGIYAAWLDRVSKKLEIHIKKDAGLKWDYVPTNGLFDGRPLSMDIAVDSKKTIHLAFKGKKSARYSIYYSRKSKSEWTEPVNLSKGLDAAYSPKLVLDSRDNLHLIWHSAFGHNSSVFYQMKTGDGWMERKLLSVKRMDSSDWMPNIAVDNNGGAHVVFFTIGVSGTTINYIQKKPGGQWGVLKKVSGNVKNSVRPNIIIDSNGAPHVFWLSGDRDEQDIYHTSRNGAQWMVPVNLTNTGRRSNDPALAAGDKGMIHLVWHEKSDKGKDDIFYMKGRGNDWSPVRNNTDTDNVSSYPRILVDQKKSINILWSERININESDIFYTTLDAF